MADKRKPETVLWVRHGSGQSIKVELFSGKQFPAEVFENAGGRHIPPQNLVHYFRVRVDGAWFPLGLKRMFNRKQCVELIKKAVF